MPIKLVLLITTVAAWASPPPAPSSVRAACRESYALMQRMWVMQPFPDNVQVLAEALALEIADSVTPEGPAPFEQFPDGLVWRFRTGEKIAQAYAEAYAARLARAAEVFRRRETMPGESRFFENDIAQIRKLFARPGHKTFVGSSRRAFLGRLAAGLMGGAALPVRMFINQIVHEGATDDGIIARMRAECSNDRAEHLRRVRAALGDRANDARVAAHLRYLDGREAAGHPPAYASRPHEYGKLRDEPNLERALYELANARPDRFDRISIRQASPHVPQEDVDARSAQIKSGYASTETRVAIAAGGTAAAAMAGDLLARVWPDIMAALRKSPELGARLDELAKMVAPDYVPRAPVERLYVGAVAFDGQHVDLYLEVKKHERAPMTAMLVGVTYRATPNSHRPAEAEKPTSVNAERLKAARDLLVAEKFRFVFNGQLDPLDAIFASARDMSLTPHELERFEAAVRAVEKLGDVPTLRKALDDLRKKEE